MSPTRAAMSEPAAAPVATPVPADTVASARTLAVPAATPRQVPWFATTGLLLLATLLAAAFVQVRQYALLSLTVHDQDDYLVVSLYQLETEYLRLHEQWRSTLDASTDAQPALQLRYDIFLSRIGLLHTGRAGRLLSGAEPSQRTLRQIDSFTRRADLYLSGESRNPLSAQAARALLGELTALGDPIHQLMIDASHQLAEQITARQRQVRQHNLIGLALTGFLSAMVLLFALIALRQLRQLEQRRQHQETLADQLRDARIEAEAASAAKSDFLADMSHELRTPLHGLLGMLTLVRQAPRDGRSADWLRSADESGAHLLRLLDEILDLSKLESGSLELAPQVVCLRTLLNELQALLQPQAQAKGLELVSAIDDDVPTHVELDPTRVRQVLFNLLGNAIKYSDAGSVTLQCRRVADAAAGAQLEFVVTDHGIGMDRVTLGRLFQRFTRAEDPLARCQGGTGLGLAISDKLARLMGGQITASSTPGAGSVFSLRCAFAPAVAPARIATAASAAAASRPLRVLVAEDHPVNRLYLAALLERLGHLGHLVENGLEAVQVLREQVFDVVLMDVHMPVMDGVAASAAIRALPAPAASIRIVALTADVFADTRERCLRAGVDEVITKPVSLAALTSVLARSQSHETGAAAQPEGGGTTAAARAGAAGTTAATRGPSGSRSAPAAPALADHDTLVSVRELMGPQRAPSLYAGFFEQAGDSARRMREAMRDADPEALERAAHAVKGAALNLGLPALAEAAATLNRDATTLGAAPLALAVQRFEELLQATRALCAGEGLNRE